MIAKIVFVLVNIISIFLFAQKDTLYLVNKQIESRATNFRCEILKKDSLLKNSLFIIVDSLRVTPHKAENSNVPFYSVTLCNKIPKFYAIGDLEFVKSNLSFASQFIKECQKSKEYYNYSLDQLNLGVAFEEDELLQQTYIYWDNNSLDCVYEKIKKHQPFIFIGSKNKNSNIYYFQHFTFLPSTGGSIKKSCQ